MGSWRRCLAFGLGFVFVVGLAAQEKRFALVIGNAEYSALGVLKNPVNDAGDMTAALSALGFKVELVINADQNRMEDAIVRFGNTLASNSDCVGLFYFAGHAIQSEGINFLIPVAASIPAETFLKSRAVAAQVVLDTMQVSKARLNLVVLDACRDNPFSWKRGGTRGLSVIGGQPPGSIIVYATGAGSTAQDGTGRNGVFTGELLKQLRQPGLEIKEIFNKTGAAVQALTKSQQIPAVYSQFFGSFVLAESAVNSPNSKDSGLAGKAVSGSSAQASYGKKMERIAFVKVKENGEEVLSSMDIDGGNLRLIRPKGTSDNIQIDYISPSPDEEMIACYRNGVENGSGTSTCSLCVFDARGNEIGRLENLPNSDPFAWSPDSSRLVYLHTRYSANKTEYYIKLWSIREQRTSVLSDTPFRAYPRAISWSPDGRLIAIFFDSMPLVFLDVSTGLTISEVNLGPDGWPSIYYIDGLRWAKDGNWLYFGVGWNTIEYYAYSFKEKKLANRSEGEKKALLEPYFLPDGDSYYWLCRNGNMTELILSDISGRVENIVALPGDSSSEVYWDAIALGLGGNAFVLMATETLDGGKLTTGDGAQMIRRRLCVIDTRSGKITTLKSWQKMRIFSWVESRMLRDDRYLVLGSQFGTPWEEDARYSLFLLDLASLTLRDLCPDSDGEFFQSPNRR